MRILIFSLAPIFPSEVHGGSQRVLAAVAKHLGSRKHDVTILCTARPDLPDQFTLSDGVTVKPILKYKPTYPEPHYTAPYNLAAIITSISMELKNCDRLYIHDAELAYHFLFDEVPTVWSFRDFLYPDTLSSGLSFRRDNLILSSQYLSDCVIETLGRYFPDIEQRIHVIPNGVDQDLFKPAAASKNDLLGISDGSFLLFSPHRPDPRKGLEQSIEILSLLSEHRGFVDRDVHLLIPRWMDSRIAQDSNHYYQTAYSELAEYADQLGVGDRLILKPWLDSESMASFYSIADVTLCVGSFVESFGNVSVEAVACGCPAVTSSIAGHKRKLREPHIFEIAPGDIDAALEAIVQIEISSIDSDAGRAEISANYCFSRMLNAYADVIENAVLREPLKFDAKDSKADSIVITAPPWCKMFDSGIYNEYQYAFISDDLLFDIYRNLPLRRSDILTLGASEFQIDAWIDQGLLGFGTERAC